MPPNGSLRRAVHDRFNPTAEPVLCAVCRAALAPPHAHEQRNRRCHQRGCAVNLERQSSHLVPSFRACPACRACEAGPRRTSMRPLYPYTSRPLRNMFPISCTSRAAPPPASSALLACRMPISAGWRTPTTGATRASYMRGVRRSHGAASPARRLPRALARRLPALHQASGPHALARVPPVPTARTAARTALPSRGPMKRCACPIAWHARCKYLSRAARLDAEEAEGEGGLRR